MSEHHHRSVQGGTIRAAVFGVSDGLVSNMGLILGVAGAHPTADVVQVAGVAGLVAGAVSMAAGEYNSMSVQADMLRRELEVEKAALRSHPEVETDELAEAYRKRGLPADGAYKLARAVMSDPDVALDAHAREELGIDPDELGQPLAAAGSSFLAFTLGASVPLLPWFFGAGNGAVAASLLLGVVLAMAVGAVIAVTSGRPLTRGILRQVAFTVTPAAITFAIGNMLGTQVG